MKGVKQLIGSLLTGCLIIQPTALIAKSQAQAKNVIIFVWDGLRPDSVSLQTTPNLYHLKESGTWFNDNHSSYPTFTMMNASTFATGDFAGKTGFFGNTLWQPTAKGKNAANTKIDFQQPVFTEDYKILQSLNHDEPLVEVTTLFNQAHKNGIKTATVGKSGAAFIQDYQSGNVIFDEKHVYPEAFALMLEKEHYPLPADTQYAYPNFKLQKNNANPTGATAIATLNDGVTTNPAVGTTSPYDKDTDYLMKSYLTKVLPYARPKLSVIWLRNPDTTEHNYGVGSKAYYDALSNQDKLLGQLITYLKDKHLFAQTDLIIVSDHAHSNTSGPLSQFPLRSIKNNDVSSIDQFNGFSVSGDFRPADLLNRAGFHAYDGEGCQYDPVLTGIKANGKGVYQTQYDTTGKICGGDVKVNDINGHRDQDVGRKYTTPAYFVPKNLEKDDIVVAANGGSTYFYVPSHNPQLVKKLVRFLQSREEFGAIFTDPRYGNLPGTLSLAQIKLENKDQRNPDIIAGSSYDESAKILGLNGTEFNSSGNSRGMHGAFSPVDVHNTLIAHGPSFKKQFIDTLPSGNVDLAPTVAYLLGFKLNNTDGRILYEAFKNNKNINNYNVQISQYSPEKPATGLTIYAATNPDDQDIVKDKSNYSIHLLTKTLQQDGKTYTYFDQAKAVRY